MADDLPDFAELDAAYWTWVKGNCPFDKYAQPKDEREWRRETRFPYKERDWSRHASPIKSNSGKTNAGWHVTFTSADGVRIMNEPVLNRRNDPDRNWGLGKE